MHGPGRDVETHLAVGECRNEDRDLLLEGAPQHAGSLRELAQALSEGAAQPARRPDASFRLGLLQNGRHKLGHLVEVGLHFERVVDAVVAELEQRFVVLRRIVPVMSQADRLGKTVGNERTGGNDRMHQPSIDQVADDAALLGDRHRAGDGEHDTTIRVVRHLHEDVEGLAELAARERRFGHCAQQVAEASSRRRERDSQAERDRPRARRGAIAYPWPPTRFMYRGLCRSGHWFFQCALRLRNEDKTRHFPDGNFA